MTWELNRRRWTRSIHSKYLFNRIPLVHTIIFMIEMALAARLVARYNAYYDRRPVVTMMVTNAILGGIADTVAQSITAIRQRSARNQQDATTFEIHELDRKNPPSERDVMATESRALASPFDFERLTRFMTYGFAMAPLQFRWFSFLDKMFPITKTAAFSPAMKRVALDQIVFAPFGIAVFFSAMTLAEGGGRRGVAQKMRDMYVPTLKANYMVWPIVQIINFRLMPVQFQLPFVSTVGIAWTAYLSLTNATEDAEQAVRPNSPQVERLA